MGALARFIVVLLRSDLSVTPGKEVIEPSDLVIGDALDHKITRLDERPLTYFLDMPRIASFAVDGVTELHESIISQERERQWGANIMLYNGVMDESIVNRLGRMTTWSETIWFSNQKYSLLHCRNQGG